MSLVVNVLLSIDIVLQVDLRLVVHLVIDVLQQEAADKTNTSEGKRSQGSDLQAVSNSPLEGS